MNKLDTRTFTPIGSLPEALTERPQWICWKYVPNGKNKPNKLPCTPQGGGLPRWQEDPKQWLTYTEAVAAYKANENLAGIGFVLTKDTGLIGVDIDSAVCPETGEVQEWASARLQTFNGTYTEASPSRTGYRAFVTGTLPVGISNKAGNLEIYDSGRWLTVTGKTISDNEITAQPVAVKQYLDAMQQQSKKKPTQGAIEVVDGVIAAGTRNVALTSIAGYLRRGGLSKAEIQAALQAVNTGRCNPALDSQEVAIIARSVARYEPALDASKSTNNEPEQFFVTPPYDLFGNFELPDFSMDIMPSVIAEYATDQGELIGVDPAVIAMFCIGVAAACIDDRLQIQPKRFDTGWRESARLWVGVIGDPSAKKSPALSKALAPAFGIDGKWRKETAKAMAEWKQATEKTKKGDKEPPAPIGKRLLINDATVEKIGDILSKCEPRGILSYQDELSGWLASMDAYKQGIGGKDKAAWLEAYNGGTRFVDRVVRGDLYVENWGISVIGGIQPNVIQKYADSADHDGMLQRFILIYAKPAAIGQDRVPQAFAQTNYNELINHLVQLRGGGVVRLSEAAHGHRESLERKLHALTLHHPNKHLTAALGKYGGLFARLLLVWHCIDAQNKQKYPTDYEVAGKTAENVSTLITSVLLPHLLYFYSALDPVQDTSQDLARLILARGWKRFTVKRDFSRYWKASRKMKPWEIEQALDRLEGFSWIAPDPNSTLNERARPSAYLVNPEVHELHQDQAHAERERRKEIAQALAELRVSHA